MRGSSLRVWIAALSVAAALAALGSTLAAQGAVAELRGRVIDESGAAVPGATLTVTHLATGTLRTTVSSETGAFVVPSLQVGAHDVRVELSGFSTLTQQNVRLGVGESANLTFTLKLATVQENITVTGETPLVDVKQSSIAGRVGTVQVEPCRSTAATGWISSRWSPARAATRARSRRVRRAATWPSTTSTAWTSPTSAAPAPIRATARRTSRSSRS